MRHQTVRIQFRQPSHRPNRLVRPALTVLDYAQDLVRVFEFRVQKNGHIQPGNRRRILVGKVLLKKPERLFIKGARTLFLRRRHIQRQHAHLGLHRIPRVPERNFENRARRAMFPVEIRKRYRRVQRRRVTP